MDEPTRTKPRNRLIEAAADLFHARSYGTVGIQDVCDRAEVRRGSFYYYFQSKDELAIEALERSTDLLVAAVHEPAFSNGGSPREEFATFLDLLLEYAENLKQRYGVYAGCPIANLAEELSTIAPHIREKVDESLQRLATYYENAVRRAMESGDATPGDAAVTAQRILALTQGALLLAKVRNDAGVLSNLGDALAVVAGFRQDDR